MTNVTAGGYAGVPLFLFHLLEFLDVEHTIAAFTPVRACLARLSGSGSAHIESPAVPTPGERTKKVADDGCRPSLPSRVAAALGLLSDLPRDLGADRGRLVVLDAPGAGQELRFYANLAASPAPTRTTSGKPSDQSMTVEGAMPQSPASTTASMT